MAGEIIKKTSPKQPGGKRRKRRLGVRIDMTPMVGLAFLLLIVYLVIIAFTKPEPERKAMEICLPPFGDTIQVGNRLTIRVDAEGRYWWNTGRAGSQNLPQLLPTHPQTPVSLVYRLDTDTLHGLLRDLSLQHYDSLNTLLIIHREAHYEDWVDIIDEIELLERALTKYRFSYRYLMNEWTQKDDRIIKDALLKVERAEALK